MEVVSELFGIKLPGTFQVEPGFLGVKKKIAVFNASFVETLTFIEERKYQLAALSKADNLEEFKKYFEDKDSGFAGGTYDDLIVPHSNFKFYEKSLKEINSGELWKRIAHSFAEAMRAKRARSEYDGDYDYDRRWDQKPFDKRERKEATTRVVKINVEASFSCGVPAETINQYGSFITAIITLLEQNGVLVDLCVAYTATGMCSSGNARVVFKLKKPNEYMPPGMILKCISGNWFRRAVFSFYVAGAELFGEKCSYYLGTPWNFGKVWELKDNELFIYSVPDFSEQHKIIEKLTEILTVIGDKNGKS